jgi:hypothetical protein
MDICCMLLAAPPPAGSHHPRNEEPAAAGEGDAAGGAAAAAGPGSSKAGARRALSHMVTAVAWSRSGRHLVCTTFDHRAILFDVLSGKQVGVWQLTALQVQQPTTLTPINPACNRNSKDPAQQLIGKNNGSFWYSRRCRPSLGFTSSSSPAGCFTYPLVHPPASLLPASNPLPRCGRPPSQSTPPQTSRYQHPT